MAVSTSVLRGLSIFSHVITWISAIIVMGITAWAVESFKSVTVIYALVIAVLSIVVFFGSLIPLVARPHSAIPFGIIAVIDGIFAFLWITAFILLANDFNRIGCRFFVWNGGFFCSRKYTAEAFTFIAFFFTLVAFILETCLLWGVSRESYARDHPVHEEKYRPDTGTTAGTATSTDGGPGPGTAAGVGAGAGAGHAAYQQPQQQSHQRQQPVTGHDGEYATTDPNQGPSRV